MIGMLDYDRGEWRSISGGYGTWVIGYLIFGTSPLLLEAYVSKLGMPESSAGILIASDFTGIGVSSVLCGYIIHRLSNQWLAFLGFAIALACNVVSIFYITHDSLIAIRFLAGVGTGMVMVAGAATISKHRQPEKMFGLVNFFTAITISIAIATGGYSLRLFGGPGVFITLTVFIALMLPFLPLLPHDVHPRSEDTERSGLPNIGLGYLFILGFVGALVCQNAGWIFVIRIGIESGYSIVQSGSILGVATTIGVTGAAIAAWLGVRYGRTVPTTLGIIALGAPWLFMCLTPGPSVYVIALVVQSIAYLFSVSFLIGTAAAMDNWGRWASVASGFQLVGSIVGPAIGGMLIERGGLELLGLTVFAGTLVALGPLLYVARRLEALSGGGKGVLSEPV